MRLKTSKAAWYAETIGRSRFIKLSSGRQHEYLAVLALKAIHDSNFTAFIGRYEEMHSWVELDRYTPPCWLSKDESLWEYFLFHNGFCRNPIEPDSMVSGENMDHPISWKHTFDVTVMLDQVRSPFNAGSVLRLIDNFGLKRMVHNCSWLSLDHPQLKKAARGCEKWIPVDYIDDIPAWLSGTDLPVFGLEREKDSIDIGEWIPEPSCILIIGNEEYGIARNLRKYCHTLISIPMFGYKQSMNLNNAFAIMAHRIASIKGINEQAIE